MFIIFISRDDGLQGADVVNLPHRTSWKNDSGSHIWSLFLSPGLVAGVSVF